MNKRTAIFLSVVVLVLATGIWAGMQLRFDFNLSTFTAKDSQEYQNYETYNSQFPMYSHGITIAIDFKEEISEISDFRTIDKLTRQLSGLTGVKKATSITSIRLPERQAFGVKKRKLLSLKDEEVFKKQLSKLENYPDVTPKFISRNNEATCIFVDLDSTDTWESITRIQKCVAEYDFPEVFFSGSEVFRKSAQDNFSSEMYVLPFVSGLGLLGLFFFFFRDWKSLLVVLINIGLNISGILTIFWLLKITVGVLTLTVPLLILVLSFCDIVHVLYTFKLKTEDVTLEDRLKATMSSLRKALWLTSLTTFGAFAIFTVSSVEQIVDFGLVTSAGIALAFFSARHILPLSIAVVKVQPFRKKPATESLTNSLKTMLEKHRMIVVVGLLILVTSGVVTTLNFSINDTPQKNIGDEIGGSIAFMNENFEGTRTIEVVVKDTNVLTHNTIHLVDSIEQYLKDAYACNSVFSINTVIKRLNRFNHFGFTQYFCLPERIDSTFFSQLEHRKEQLGLLNAVTDDHKLLRIVGRLKDEGSSIARIRNEKLQAFIDRLPFEEEQIFISGHSYVYDQSIYRVTSIVLVSVMISVLMAMLVIGSVFKSIRLVFALFIPNVLPLIVALLFMLALDIDLNPFSAMALSILLGLSIDDTIYITIGAFGKKGGDELHLGRSLEKNVFPIVVTSLLLAVGFGSMIFSNVESNKNIGVLVSVVLLIALISDLLLLPALLKWLIGNNRKAEWKL